MYQDTLIYYIQSIGPDILWFFAFLLIVALGRSFWHLVKHAKKWYDSL